MIKTERLLLRQWQDEDLPHFAKMSRDAELMRYFPATLSRSESDAIVDRLRQHIASKGWGVWAVELQETNEFIGVTGLQHQPTRFSFSPCTEVAWRIARSHWRRGYATEAANAALDFGFNQLALPEIVSFAVSQNRASIGVMEKIGMKADGARFLHPELPENHSLAEHVLYRIDRQAHRARN